MAPKFNLFFLRTSRYRAELLKEIRLLIIITLGFTIAFTWRQTTFDTAQSLVLWLTNIKESVSLSILTSVFTTIIALIIILITSYFLKNSHDNY